MARERTYAQDETGTDGQSAPVSAMGGKLASTDAEAAREAAEPLPEAVSEGAAPSPTDAADAQEPEPRRDVLHFSHAAITGDAAPVTEPPAAGDGGAQDAVPPEQILFQRQFCIRGKGSDCNRCEMACPTGAISMDENGWPSIDDRACTRCGICYGVCDAFTSSRVNVIDLHNRMQRMADIDGTVYLTCRENVFTDTQPAANVLTVPCLAALSPEFIASALAQDIQLVVAGDLNYCDDCRIAGDRGALMYEYAFQTAEAWTGRTVSFTDQVPEQRDLVERINRDSRRDAISGLLSVVGDVASGRYRSSRRDAVDEFESVREQMHSHAWNPQDFDHPLNRAMRKPGKFKLLFPRRKFLLDAVQDDAATARELAVTISSTDPQRCTCNFDCVNACITGARGIDGEDLLTFDARYCIGCGLCVEACGNGACELREVPAGQLEPARRVADEAQVRAMLGRRAAALAADGTKTAMDADRIFGSVKPPNPWA